MAAASIFTHLRTKPCHKGLVLGRPTPSRQSLRVRFPSRFQAIASSRCRVYTVGSRIPTPAREDPQAVTVTAAALRAASQRGLRGPVCRHRGSQHAARSADCAEELRGASAKRWRSVAECMHGAKERSQREALAECWRSQREALAEPAGSRWLRAGISAERLYSAARTVHPIPLHGARRI